MPIWGGDFSPAAASLYCMEAHPFCRSIACHSLLTVPLTSSAQIVPDRGGAISRWSAFIRRALVLVVLPLGSPPCSSIVLAWLSGGRSAKS